MILYNKVNPQPSRGDGISKSATA